MLKALYLNTIFERGIGIASAFSGMTLNVFWKRALHLEIYILCSRSCACSFRIVDRHVRNIIETLPQMSVSLEKCNHIFKILDMIEVIFQQNIFLNVILLERS